MSLDLPGPLAAMLGYGLPGIFVLATVEKLIPVIPSYVLYVFLGMTVVGADGLGLTLAVSVAGSTLGGLAWYAVGRAIGQQRIESVIDRHGRFVLLGRGMFDRLTRAYRNNAIWVTGIGHVIPVVRFYLPIPAGVLALPLPGYLLASGLGCLVWNGLLLTLGYALAGTGLPPLQVGLAAIACLLAVETVVALGVRRQMRGTGHITDPAG